ncbi:glycosyltransferase [Geofilum rubicundum]|uniref:glycosyltransferase n=1 Tax=Geofilum rubicundum TaxID=472113 RepID=UPI000AF138C9|nr:glycosyltransferase [Geofilum rubicundum]
MSQHYPDNKYLLYNPKESKNNLFLNSFDNVTEKRPKNKRDTFFYNLWRQKNVCKDLLHDQVDIFHGLTGEIPLGIRKTGIPVVVTIHDLIFLRFPKFYSFIDYKIHKYKAQYAVNNADMVVAVSEQTKQDIIDFFGIDAEK